MTDGSSPSRRGAPKQRGLHRGSFTSHHHLTALLDTGSGTAEQHQHPGEAVTVARGNPRRSAAAGRSFWWRLNIEGEPGRGPRCGLRALHELFAPTELLLVDQLLHERVASGEDPGRGSAPCVDDEEAPGGPQRLERRCRARADALEAPSPPQELPSTHRRVRR